MSLKFSKQDVLLHHPYTALQHGDGFYRAAAGRPDDAAIKSVSTEEKDSPIVKSHSEVSERGKQVAALVEAGKPGLTERKQCIEWARASSKMKAMHVVQASAGSDAFQADARHPSRRQANAAYVHRHRRTQPANFRNRGWDCAAADGKSTHRPL